MPTVDKTLYNILHRSVNAMKNIPDTIRAARMNAAFSQKELGEKLGYEGRSAEVTVQRWESGARPVPLEKIRALAAALNLTLDDLIP